MDEPTLEGILDRITFQNPENHFLIGRMVVTDAKAPVTIKGVLYNVREGQTVRLWGRWEEHPEYGRQFAATAFLVVEPTTLEGMERYLASGIIKGVGEVTARRIVRAFGHETFDILDNSPEKLLEVPKFPKKALKEIKRAWREQQAIRDIMVFLHAQGISQAYAERIFSTYGFESVEVVKDNPYRLAMDVQGIGFRIADAIATRIGIAHDDPRRADAGVLYLMEELLSEGHTGLPREMLEPRAAALLEVSPPLAREAIARLEGDGLLKTLPPSKHLPEAGDFLARPRMYKAEKSIAEHLSRIANAPSSTELRDLPLELKKLENDSGVFLAEAQRKAVLAAVENKVLIVTGGPGTGKTTIIRFILGLVARDLPQISLAAPTGRAAKRLSEATGRPASTLHRLLESGKKGFLRNRENPIEAELVIVDESSMMDTLLTDALLEALPDHVHLVLVGDVDQLPSVGAGMVLGDLILSGKLPVVRLEEVFRQAERSRITANAHAIRRGDTPNLSRPEMDELVDFYFMPESEPARIVEKMLMMVRERIPERFGFDPIHDVQVLTPMHRGLTGAQNLNAELQRTLNRDGTEITFGDLRFRVGDKVMQTRNDYDKEVFNGDMGEITAYDADAAIVAIEFDGREVIYERRELDALTLGYAITVHKSQGSEYPAVLLPITTQHTIMLQRNLIYTAITRARKLLVLIGTEKALAMAVRNVNPDLRHTRLRQQLMEADFALEEQ